MSKISCKNTAKKTVVKLVKKNSKNSKVSKGNSLKITVLPVWNENEPYTKTINNKNNETNLKLVWTKEELMKIYGNILPKSKPLNFSVYTK